jgi:transposase
MNANRRECLKWWILLSGALADWTCWSSRTRTGVSCPICGRRGRIVRVLPEVRWWRDIPVGGWSVWLQYCPKEILCPTHGRRQEQIPWAREYGRATYRFEYLMLRYCQVMPQKDASTLLHTAASTLSDLLHRCVTAVRDGHKIRGLRRIGIDEISYAKGHKYATLVYDLDRACIVWVGDGKGRETIDVSSTRRSATIRRRRFGWPAAI